MGTINIPFEIGAKVWTPSCDHIGPEFVECPECAGKLLHTLILGCGQEVKVKCHQCGPGYQDPCGRVRNQDREWAPYETTLVSLHSIHDGKASYYDVRQYLLDEVNLFATRDECLVKCASRNAEQREEDSRRILATLSDRRDSVSFSATYYLRQRAELKRKLAAIEEKLATTGINP